jgi:hypothetical protein
LEKGNEVNRQETVATSGAGIGFFGLLTVLFIGLKLTGYIDWSWWWVLSPIWIPWAMVIGFLLVITFFATVMSYFEGK